MNMPVSRNHRQSLSSLKLIYCLNSYTLPIQLIGIFVFINNRIKK